MIPAYHWPWCSKTPCSHQVVRLRRCRRVTARAVQETDASRQKAGVLWHAAPCRETCAAGNETCPVSSLLCTAKAAHLGLPVNHRHRRQPSCTLCEALSALLQVHEDGALRHTLAKQTAATISLGHIRAWMGSPSSESVSRAACCATGEPPATIGLLAYAPLGLHMGYTPMQCVQPPNGCTLPVDLEGTAAAVFLEMLRRALAPRSGL